MVKHISKIIKETELYKELQERKHDIGHHEETTITTEIQRRQFEEFLPGISEKDFLSIGFEGLPIRTQKKSQKDVFQRKNDPDSET